MSDMPHCIDTDVLGMHYPGDDAAERAIWNCLANFKVTAQSMKERPKAYINQLV